MNWSYIFKVKRNMYCPKCYNNSLSMASRGVVDIIINGKQMDAGRFLYNINKESKFKFLKNVLLK